jgi:hypothetical protein
MNYLCLCIVQHIGGSHLVASVSQLQKFAIRALSQTCSASGCEHNWSVFERIHTKKRNLFGTKTVKGSCLRAIQPSTKVQPIANKRLDTYPIVLDDIDPTLEWVEESHPPEFDPDFDIDDLEFEEIGLDPDPLVGVGVAPGMAHASTSCTTRPSCASASTTILL